MATGTTVEAPQTPAAAPGSRVAALLPRIATVAVTLLPGALVLYFSFNGGGYFPGGVGFAGIVLIQALILRVLLADRPFEGYTRAFVGVGLALTAFAGWVLLSGTWAHALNRTLVEFDRALVYVLVFAVMGCIARSSATIQWVVRWLALAMAVVCTVALITRVLPHVWPTSSSFANRLSYPLTYWNALGILAGCGLLIALGLSSTLREPRVVRAAAAGAVPIFATTLFFTFSRGAIVATIVAAIVLVVLLRSPGLPAALLAAIPPAIIAVIAAYHADELATMHPATARGVSQGKDVAVVVLLCVLAAIALRLLARPLDRRLAAVKLSETVRKRGRLALGGAVLLALVVAIAAGGPGWVSREYKKFTKGGATSSTDFRARLTDPSANGRLEHWRVAGDEFLRKPLDGSGAGTYEHLWEQHRRQAFVVVDGHSLYVEVAGELGIVGLLLVVGVIVAILVALLRRARGPNRAIYVALFAATLAWAIHAGVDWDWEMPAVTAWIFAVGGLALSGRRNPKPAPATSQRWRIPLAIVLLVMAATPALLLFSQSRLGAAASAFESGDCPTAQARAIDSINALAIRPEPYQILGYCDLKEGRVPEAVAAMRKAIDAESGSWEYHYGLALAQAAGGSDPMPELRRSLQLNPREQISQKALQALRNGNPQTWPAASAKLVDSTIQSGRLTIR